MGVAPGGDGEMCPPPGSEFRGDVPPEIAIFKEKILNICHFLDFQYFQNKVFEIRGEIGIRGLVFLNHLNLSPQSESVLPSRNFVVTPLLGGIKNIK